MSEKGITSKLKEEYDEGYVAYHTVKEEVIVAEVDGRELAEMLLNKNYDGENILIVSVFSEPDFRGLPLFKGSTNPD